MNKHLLVLWMLIFLYYCLSFLSVLGVGFTHWNSFKTNWSRIWILSFCLRHVWKRIFFVSCLEEACSLYLCFCRDYFVLFFKTLKHTMRHSVMVTYTNSNGTAKCKDQRHSAMVSNATAFQIQHLYWCTDAKYCQVSLSTTLSMS